jgi:hypothetical protein
MARSACWLTLALLLARSTASTALWWSDAPVPSIAAASRQREKTEKPNLVTRHHVRRMLYFLTAVNPMLVLCSNQYSTRIRVPGSSTVEPKVSPLAGVYRTLFYFARLKPRLMFSVGAALRALQMTTPIHFVFDPGAGVGAGLNLLALASSSRWPAMLVLGWSLSKQLWAALGAKPPPRSPVPITVAVVNDPETGQAEVIPISIGLHQLSSRKPRRK